MTKKNMFIASIYAGIYCGLMWLSGFIVGYGCHGGDFIGECIEWIKSKVGRNKNE